MTIDISNKLATLATQDRELRFPSFVHDDALAVGQHVIDLSRERDLTIATAIWLGEQLVFQAALSGTTADNDGWMNRKVAVVRRFDKASLFVAEQMASYGITDPATARMVDPMLYAFNGGAVPIRIGATQVGVAVASGVNDDVEHDIVVEALKRHLRH